jgi:hypothetical protein
VRVPVPFGWAINALNGDQEFHPTGVAARRLVTMPDGAKAIQTFKPYWLQLRDSAYMIAHARALNVKRVQLRDPDDMIALTQALNTGQPAFSLPSQAMYRKAQDEFVHTLRDLVERWHESNWNLAACFQNHPDVRLRVERLLRRQPLALLAASSGPSLLINRFAPAGLFGLKRNRGGKHGPLLDAREEAITLFIRLVQHPDCSRMGKCKRCGRYFYGRPGQQCCPRPRRCGSYLAAIRATKATWHETRKGLIAQAQEAIKRWELDGVRALWKPWVAKRVRKTEKWVTRAINREELKPPRIVDESNRGGDPPKKGKHNAN